MKSARMGDVRVVLYAGSDGGSVQILRNGHWGIARPGEVSYGTVIELTREAMRSDAEAMPLDSQTKTLLLLRRQASGVCHPGDPPLQR